MFLFVPLWVVFFGQALEFLNRREERQTDKQTLGKAKESKAEDRKGKHRKAKKSKGKPRKAKHGPGEQT